MNAIQKEDIQCALEIAKEGLETAYTSCTLLADLLDSYGAGENGGAGIRMQRYIVPSLETWLSDPQQIGSLASIEDELRQEEDQVTEDFSACDFNSSSLAPYKA